MTTDAEELAGSPRSREVPINAPSGSLMRRICVLALLAGIACLIRALILELHTGVSLGERIGFWVAGAVLAVVGVQGLREEQNVVDLDEERKAATVSNLLVVLCSDHPTQPIVNAGSLYH